MIKIVVNYNNSEISNEFIDEMKIGTFSYSTEHMNNNMVNNENFEDSFVISFRIRPEHIEYKNVIKDFYDLIFMNSNKYEGVKNVKVFYIPNDNTDTENIPQYEMISLEDYVTESHRLNEVFLVNKYNEAFDAENSDDPVVLINKIIFKFANK